jgi:hypothetical protein
LKYVDNDLPATEEPRNGVRVGWSVVEAGLQLGMCQIKSGNSQNIGSVEAGKRIQKQKLQNYTQKSHNVS